MQGEGSMCHGVSQDDCMMNVTKVSNVLCALLVLRGGCRCVLRGGAGDAIAMRQQEIPSQMATCISPNPKPTILCP